MNVGEMCSYISYLVDDLNFGYFTKPQLYRFINQAAAEAQKKLIAAGNNWYLKKDESQTTIINQELYTPPTDLMDINRIELVQNPGPNETRYPLTSITLNQKDMFGYNPAQTYAFYFFKNQIAFVPIPNTNQYTIRFYYTYRIAEITGDSDTVDMPAEFHEYVCHLAALKCFIKDGRDASLLLKFTDDVEKRLERQAIQRAQDRATTIVQTSTDFGYVSY